MSETKIIQTKYNFLFSTGKLDIFIFMKSKAISEYFRTHTVFTCLEKAQIIIFSFCSVETKLKALEILVTEADVNEKNMIFNLKKALKFINEEAYHPSEDYLYSVSWKDLKSLNNKNCFDHSIETTSKCYFAIEDFLADFEDYYTYNKESYDSLTRFSIEMYPTKKDASNINGIKEPNISVSGYFTSEGFCPYFYSVNREWAKTHGISEETLDLISKSSLTGYSLPFRFGQNIMIKTPFMHKPLYGFIGSDLDGDGRWYHWFYYEEERNGEIISGSMDLGYHEITFASNLSVFDWVYPSDKKMEPSDRIKDQLAGYYCEEEIVPIASIDREGIFRILCRIKAIDSDHNVVLADATGEISGHMTVREYDSKWLYEKIDTGELLNILILCKKDPTDGQLKVNGQNSFLITNGVLQ